MIKIKLKKIPLYPQIFFLTEKLHRSNVAEHVPLVRNEGA